jgi:hypothetical protein
MTKLDDAMLKHMAYLAKVEERPFSYKDFEKFEVNGQIYSVAHGTFRNKISRMIKQKIADLVYNSKISFYTLREHPFGNRSAMTVNLMGISSVIPVTGVIPYTLQTQIKNRV